MKTNEVIKSIQRNPVVTSNIPLEAQMGYPVFSLGEGKLFVSFLFNLSRLDNQSVSLFLPRYSLKVIYPFNKIVKFEDLAYSKNHSFHEFETPVSTLTLSSLHSVSSKAKMEDLIVQSDRLLEEYETQKMISNDKFDTCRKLVYSLIAPTFLAIYKEETE